MTTTPPRPEKRRHVPPLMWASGGTLVLHSAFLLMLWLWPKPPAPSRETLLEVDLSKDKKAPEPTAQPTIQPTEEPIPTPRPLIKPRLAKVTRQAPVIIPTPQRRPIPRVMPRIAKAPLVIPTTIPAPSPKTETPPKAPESKPVTRPTAEKSEGSKGSRPAPRDDTQPTPAAAPSGGSRRFFARNDEPNEERKSREGRAGMSASAQKGSNNRGQGNETAGALPGLDLPRTQARRGRISSLAGPSGAAPTTSKDGTEVNIGPSAPTFSGGSRRAAAGLGSGEDDSGALRTGGLPSGVGTRNLGNSRMGRGADEAAGDGINSGTRGAGARGNSRRGRTGSRLVGDPFGTGGGTKGNGQGASTDGNDGAGGGPKGGTLLARRGLGEGGGDGDGTGDGRFGLGGPGGGRGNGNGAGEGQGSDGTTGTGKGRGTGEAGEGDGAIEGGGRGNTRRGRSGRRAGETEDQMGRGIWGGFKMTFYQDKADHPDLPDATFHPDSPIDWPVFTKVAGKKTVPNLNFDWGETPPVPGMKSTFWSLKANGRIFVPKDDTYTFYFDELDDAGSLVLDGETIIKIWKVQKSTPSSRQVFLKRGAHDIQIQYVQGPATAASIKLSWRSTSFTKEIVGVYQAPEE